MNWKTTTLGILTIVLALANAIYQYLAVGTPPNFATLCAAITAGWGLIHAKDANVTNAPIPVPSRLAAWIVLAILLPFVLIACTGCQNGRYVGPPLTFGATYTEPNGSAISGNIKLDPSMLAAKKGASLAHPRPLILVKQPNFRNALPTLRTEDDQPVYPAAPLIVTNGKGSGK